MTFRVLAADYDGTLATDGEVDESVVAALARARDSGLALVLVTGRELASLFNTFAHVDVFDRVVAENGAVLYDPGTGTVDVLAPAPPPSLLSALEHTQIPISVGHSIVATVTPHEREMLAVMRSLGLEWRLIFNKRAVMALPAGVTKATGLAAALQALHATADQTVGIGDAENDLAFLRECGLSVAVSNALPAIKEVADLVLPTARGAGVIELVTRLLSRDVARSCDDREINLSRSVAKRHE